MKAFRITCNLSSASNLAELENRIVHISDNFSFSIKILLSSSANLKFFVGLSRTVREWCNLQFMRICSMHVLSVAIWLRRRFREFYKTILVPSMFFQGRNRCRRCESASLRPPLPPKLCSSLYCVCVQHAAGGIAWIDRKHYIQEYTGIFLSERVAERSSTFH